MTTFSVLLRRNSSPVAIEKMRTDLEALFQEHEFVAGADDFPDIENNILAIDHRTVGDDGLLTSHPPDSTEVEQVKSVFFELLRDLPAWKPS